MQPANKLTVLLEVPCPRCGAPIGQPCHTPTRELSLMETHTARHQALTFEQFQRMTGYEAPKGYQP